MIGSINLKLNSVDRYCGNSANFGFPLHYSEFQSQTVDIECRMRYYQVHPKQGAPNETNFLHSNTHGLNQEFARIKILTEG